MNINWSLDDTALLVLALISGAALFAFVIAPLVPSLRLSSRSSTSRTTHYLNLCGTHATPNLRRTSSPPIKPTQTLSSL